MNRKLLMMLIWILTPVAVLGYVASPGILFSTGDNEMLILCFSISLAASIIVLTAISLLKQQ